MTCPFCDRPNNVPHFYGCDRFVRVPHRASYSHHGQRNGEYGAICGTCGEFLIPGKKSGTWKHSTKGTSNGKG